MRTKNTAAPRKGRPQPNGTTTPARATQAPPQDVKSPSQPQELSEKDKARLKEYLDNTDVPFSVKTIPLTRKRKRAGTSVHTQSDIFEERLDVQYEVKPASNWESMRRYKKFTVGSESIAVGEVVLVKHSGSDDKPIDLAAQWKAKVLEVRALDTEHVYIRVSWLNRPEDLDTGRKAYHGRFELVPTNQMDIIDAMAVNGRIDVYHWVDSDEDSAMPGKEEFFWRQTYDFTNTKTFSKLHLLCRDQTPQNPDELILQCSNTNCKKWMHARCIAEDAVQRASEDDTSAQVPKKKARPKSLSTTSVSDTDQAAQAVARSSAGITAEVYVKDMPDGPDDEPAKTSEIVITNAEGEKQTEDIKCLFCSTAIE